jgi:hypothetical protein
MHMNPVQDVFYLRPLESADHLYAWFQWTGFLGFWAGVVFLCLAIGACFLLVRRREPLGFALLVLGWLAWLGNGVLGFILCIAQPPTHTPETEIIAQALAVFPAQGPFVLPFLAVVLAVPAARRQAREQPGMACAAALATLNAAALLFPLGLFASFDVNPVRYVWGCWF